MRSLLDSHRDLNPGVPGGSDEKGSLPAIKAGHRPSKLDARCQDELSGTRMFAVIAGRATTGVSVRLGLDLTDDCSLGYRIRK